MKADSAVDMPAVAERPSRESTRSAAHDVVNRLFGVGLEIHQALRTAGDQWAAAQQLRDALAELDAAINSIRRMLYAESVQWEDTDTNASWPEPLLGSDASGAGSRLHAPL